MENFDKSLKDLIKREENQTSLKNRKRAEEIAAEELKENIRVTDAARLASFLPWIEESMREITALLNKANLSLGTATFTFKIDLRSFPLAHRISITARRTHPPHNTYGVDIMINNAGKISVNSGSNNADTLSRAVQASEPREISMIAASKLLDLMSRP